MFSGTKHNSSRIMVSKHKLVLNKRFLGASPEFIVAWIEYSTSPMRESLKNQVSGKKTLRYYIVDCDLSSQRSIYSALL